MLPTAAEPLLGHSYLCNSNRLPKHACGVSVCVCVTDPTLSNTSSRWPVYQAVSPASHRQDCILRTARQCSVWNRAHVHAYRGLSTAPPDPTKVKPKHVEAACSGCTDIQVLDAALFAAHHDVRSAVERPTASVCNQSVWQQRIHV